MTDILSDSKVSKKSIYVFYWAGYVLLFSLIQGYSARDFLTAFYNELFGIVPKIFFVLIIVEWLMDKLLFRKRIALFIGIYIILLFLFAFIQRMIDNYIILAYFLTNWIKEPLFNTPPFLYNVIKLQFIVTIPFSIKLFYYWSKEQNRVQVIQSEKMQAELQSLRNQFHPHFMFNVLNSLYAKILSKSDDAADMVLNISSLLRFSVYEVNDKMVSLEKEIKHLSNYISLQQMRFDNRLQLSFSVTGIIKDEFIEPFILLPFIENSFKYCMNDELAGGWVTIFISITEDWLTLKIENSLPKKIDTDKQHLFTANKGQGLINVKRRLELLYPDNHLLKITEAEDSFFVSLKIKLYAGSR